MTSRPPLVLLLSALLLAGSAVVLLLSGDPYVPALAALCAATGLGLASVATDAKGEFALSFTRAVTTDRIVAIAPLWRPAAMDRPREPRGEDTGWPDSVELALPGPVLSIFALGLLQERERGAVAVRARNVRQCRDSVFECPPCPPGLEFRDVGSVAQIG